MAADGTSWAPGSSSTLPWELVAAVENVVIEWDLIALLLQEQTLS